MIAGEVCGTAQQSANTPGTTCMLGRRTKHAATATGITSHLLSAQAMCRSRSWIQQYSICGASLRICCRPCGLSALSTVSRSGRLPRMGASKLCANERGSRRSRCCHVVLWSAICSASAVASRIRSPQMRAAPTSDAACKCVQAPSDRHQHMQGSAAATVAYSAQRCKLGQLAGPGTTQKDNKSGSLLATAMPGVRC